MSDDTPKTFEGAMRDLDRLLATFDAERAARFSFRDLHAKGLTYINLQSDPALMVKLYIMRPGAISLNANGFVVDPHDHAYDFATFVLAGSLGHHTFDDERPGDREWHKFEYRSPMRGGDGFRHRCAAPLLEASYTNIPTGGHYRIDSSAVHTISVDPEVLTALMLYQQPDKPCAFTRFYSRSPEAPDTAGLYGRMTPAEVAREVDSLFDGILQ